MPENDAPVSTEKILYGQDAVQNIVSIEPDYQAGVWVYRRQGEAVVRERAAYRPWMLLTCPPEAPLNGSDSSSARS